MNGYSFWNAVASGRREPQAVIKCCANDAHRSRDVDGEAAVLDKNVPR